jgi:translation initiation factor IF-3
VKNEVKTKEVKFRVTTERHDLETKVKNIRRWLSEGDKVKLLVQMRGREQAHPKYATAMLDVVLSAIPSFEYTTEKPARVEGRNAFMVIRPNKNMQRKRV